MDRPASDSTSHSARHPAYLLANDLACALAVGVAYLLIARLSLSHLVDAHGIAAFWLASGLALAALLITNGRTWPWILAAIFGVNLFGDLAANYTLATSLGLALANTVEPLVGGLLLRHFEGRRITLDGLPQVIRFIALGAVVPSLVGAFIGAGTLAVMGGAGLPLAIGRLWFINDAMGIIALAPFILTFRKTFRGLRKHATLARRIEAAAFGVGTLLVSISVFTNAFTGNGRHDASYFVFPFLVWGALRFGVHGAAVTSLTTAVVAIWCTAQGLGPFAHSEADGGSMFEVQLFMGVLILTSYALAAVLEERNRAKEQLGASEARYRTMTEHAPEALVVLDVARSRFVEANRQALDLFGMDEKALLEVGPADISPAVQPDGRPSPEAAMALIERTRRGEAPVVQWVHRNVDGEDIPCEVRLVKLPSEDGELIRGSVTDIRDRRRLESQLRQSQKMESIGQLAGGVAHDFNNLLMAITGHLQLAHDRLPPRHSAHTEIESAERAADRAAGLTRQLLGFARKQIARPEAVNLALIVDDMKQMLTRLLGETIEVRTQGADGLWNVRADVGQIEQVIMNLAVNARDAMPEGGVLTLELDNAAMNETGDLPVPGMPAGEYVRLRVTDTGNGMDERVREHAFEPFFTTKRLGMGTGLGLATCYGIVKQSGGQITCDSVPGEGATFTVYLPRTSRAVDTPLREEATTPLRGTETVLVAEDDAGVRALVVQTLRRQGYAVIEAADGPGALSVIEARPSVVRLLVTDMVMPGMTGSELVDKVQQCAPHIRALIMSGYADVALPPDTRTVTFLHKPFSPAVLIQRVREMLDMRDSIAAG